MTANLTRRRMLAAAGIGTAAAAFSGAASAQCRNDLKWDETHEIVVVGAGGAGMAAAVKAAQTGAKDILVLEKLAFTGGNTLIAQGFINAADPVRQPRQGIKDSPENHMKQTLAAGDFRGDPERVKVLCDNAYGAITWLESLGMKFKDNVIQIFGALYPRSHIPALPKGQGYGTVLTKAAKELGVQVRTGLGVTEIIREEQFAGRVIGVKVQPASSAPRRRSFSPPAASPATATCASCMTRASRGSAPTTSPAPRAKSPWPPCASAPTSSAWTSSSRLPVLPPARR